MSMYEFGVYSVYVIKYKGNKEKLKIVIINNKTKSRYTAETEAKVGSLDYYDLLSMAKNSRDAYIRTVINESCGNGEISLSLFKNSELCALTQLKKEVEI